jgi:hypothetical protein
MTKQGVPTEVSNYFKKIGSKSGKKLLAERGPEYFSKISRMRHSFSRQKKVTSSEEYTIPEKK